MVAATEIQDYALHIQNSIPGRGGIPIIATAFRTTVTTIKPSNGYQHLKWQIHEVSRQFSDHREATNSQ
jgi:D-hexose-6-phosphate mutarotase